LYISLESGGRKMKGKKHYTDQERFEAVKRYKLSGMSIRAFANKH
jgi:transposase-like protein